LSTKFLGKSNDDYNNLKRSEDKCKLGLCREPKERQQLYAGIPYM
jgi:hypothetical protein